MTLSIGTEQLTDFLKTYMALSEKEKLALGEQFHQATGGKLSPYDSPSPVCVALVPVEDANGKIGFLGVRRAIAPHIGGIALPGGFLSPHEDPRAAAVREVLEETGIALEVESFCSNNQCFMAHNNTLLLFFETQQIVSAETFADAQKHLAIRTDGEASELVYITPETTLCFPLHQQVVSTALSITQGCPPKPTKRVR